MKKEPTKKAVNTAVPRPPVVAIMGHIDHGKSTLLDFIRKTHITDKEAGSITQHLGAYETTFEGDTGAKRRITFLDTPGHAAFGGIRERSAKAADIAILVVSGEEGVKPQTIEAYKRIIESNLTFIVAVTKSDSPKFNLERTRQSLAEHEIFTEGYGGDVSTIAVSGKTGDGIKELLDLIALTADMAEITYDPHLPAHGVIVEAHRDEKRGNAATIVIKNGTLTKGSWLSSGNTTTPVRYIENDLGQTVDTATASTPVGVIGWNALPPIGEDVFMHPDRKSAEAALVKKPSVDTTKKTDVPLLDTNDTNSTPIKVHTLNVIVKADTASSAEAVVGELKKLSVPEVTVHIIESGVGDITESDLKLATARTDCVLVAFNAAISKKLTEYALRENIPVLAFDIIYTLVETIQTMVKERTPKVILEEMTARVKIIRVFSVDKDKQIVGGRVEEGTLTSGSSVKLFRRDAPIGVGKIRNIEHNKQKVTEVKKGSEFGMMIESKIIIAPGDSLQSFTQS